MKAYSAIALLMLSQLTSAPFPQTEISNGSIRATIYLPDKAAGYYRGTRFDWSGQIASLTWKGHEYFGPWFERHDPRIHDAITGPVEEFLTGADSSLGYAEAKPGDLFVRIGVGAVRKPAEPAYRRFETYEIVDPGKWTINKGADRVEFVHALEDTNGYAYIYRKILRLERDAFVLEHALRNTGRKAIDTSVYNHNFFTIDGATTGPDVVVRFPFAPRAMRPLNGLGEIRGNEFVFLKPFEPRQTLFTEIEGFGPTAGDYGFQIENRKSGAAVRVTGDRPVLKLYFWSAPRTTCPEPYIDASAAPGQETTWRIRYELYEARRD